MKRAVQALCAVAALSVALPAAASQVSVNNGVLITGSGTWSDTSQTTLLSAPSATWSFSFSEPDVAAKPEVLLRDASSLGSLKYTLNGVNIPLSPSFVDFMNFPMFGQSFHVFGNEPELSVYEFSYGADGSIPLGSQPVLSTIIPQSGGYAVANGAGLMTVSTLGSPSNAQVASAASAWGNALQTVYGAGPSTQQLTDAVIAACADGIGDCDAASRALQQHQLQGLAVVKAAATSSEGLILATPPDPSSGLDVAAFLLTNGKALITNVLDLFDTLSGKGARSGNSVTVTGAVGNEYQLAYGGLNGLYYDVAATIQVSDDEIANLTPGQAVLTDLGSVAGPLRYGEATLISAIDPPGYGTVQLEFQGFMPTAAAVPEPSSWLLLIGGFAGIGLALRAARRCVARSSSCEQEPFTALQ